MQRHTMLQSQPVTAQDADGIALEKELSILRAVLRLLPTGVTVQDEQGGFVLVNDAAAARLGMVAGQPSDVASKQLSERREAGLELLRAGRAFVAEDSVAGDQGRQVFLTAHRPVRIADQNLLLSSSADISEQKALEDHLFRAAYFDELTDLPMRRVIEHRAQSLIQRGGPGGRFALAFLDIDNFKHI